MTEFIECPEGNLWCGEHEFERPGDEKHDVCRGVTYWSVPLDPTIKGLAVQPCSITDDPGFVYVDGVGYTPEGTRELISLLQAALDAVETCPLGTDGCYSHQTNADGTFVCQPRNHELVWATAAPVTA